MLARELLQKGMKPNTVSGVLGVNIRLVYRAKQRDLALSRNQGRPTIFR